MLSKITKFRALSPTDKVDLCLAVLYLPTFALALKAGRFPRSRSSRRQGDPDAVTPTRAEARRVIRLVDLAAGSLPLPSTCLTRAMTAHRILRRRGIDTDLRIGVRLDGAALAAHAWLELAGQALSAPPADGMSYQPLLLPQEAFLPEGSNR